MNKGFDARFSTNSANICIHSPCFKKFFKMTGAHKTM